MSKMQASTHTRELDVPLGCARIMYNKGGIFRVLLLISVCCIMYYFGIELERSQEKSVRGIQPQQFQPARADLVYQGQQKPEVKETAPEEQQKPEVKEDAQEEIQILGQVGHPVAPAVPTPGKNNQLANLEDICDEESMKKQDSFDPAGVSRLFAVDKDHPIFYCPIQKVGSSFWLRTLTVMGSKNKYATPYEITLAQKNLQYYAALKKTMTPAEQKEFLKDAFSFIFVRDPYSRLFSGYIDKVYYPNVVYWPSFTTKIVKAVRKNPSADSLKFGHDVTFAEFVEYIVKLWESGAQLDIHFAPMHDLCNPCKVKYSFVGRFENFQEDAEYLMEYFRSRFPDFTLRFDDFEEESVYDETIRHVRMLFASIETNKETLKYPIYKFLQRGWSNAQLRGHLSKSEDMPFIPKMANNVTVESFMEAFEDAEARPANKTLIKYQRVEALIQAYRTVPLGMMERLHKMLGQDCQWFGYEDRPANLYDRKHTELPDHDYLLGL